MDETPSVTEGKGRPHARTLFIVLANGLKEWVPAVARTFRRHPWWTAVGVVVSTACGTWLCPYFGATMVIAGMIWAGKADRQLIP